MICAYHDKSYSSLGHVLLVVEVLVSGYEHLHSNPFCMSYQFTVLHALQAQVPHRYNFMPGYPKAEFLRETFIN